MDQQRTPSTPPSGGQGSSASAAQEEIERLKRIIAEQKNALAEQKNALAEQKNALAEQKNALAEHIRDISKTKLFDFLSLVNERVYEKFTVETDRSQLAQGTTSVAGKFCPRRLRPWADFATLHDQTFQNLEDVLNPRDACFASPKDISGFLSAFSPKSKNEATLRPFLRIALEKPAAVVVDAYLHAVSDSPDISPDKEMPTYVYFKDEDKKTATPSQGSNSNNSSNRAGNSIPDRICLYHLRNGAKSNVRFLVGEYKAAHRLTAPKLQHVLESPPEDFLARAAGIDQDVAPEDATNDAVFSSRYPSVYLAKALCQTYDYMIGGALEYGYIATGYGLLLLHIVPTDLDTLYYHCVTFALDGAQHPPLHPKQTAAAYMATLILLAKRETAPTNDEINTWAQNRLRWPKVQYRGKKANVRSPTIPEDPDKDEDGGPGRSKVRRGGRDADKKGGSRRPGSDRVLRSSVAFREKGGGGGGGGGATDGVDDTAASERRPLALDLPYCTQACLLGVVHQRPLDEKCRNVERHRAASLRMHGDPDRHPLTVAGIREALLVQAKAAENDPTQRCAHCGREGRYGSLLRVAVTCAGYVFVAKATYTGCVSELEHEVRVYNALRDYQGKLIPVCLGVMTFWSARFAADCMMRSLLFLSYAGQDLGKPERLPLNVNLQAAMDRTTKELYDLGLRNRDVRIYNCAWNPETRRVMHFDFDQATMVGWKTDDAAEEEEEEDVSIREDDDAQDQVQKDEPATQRAPLRKRDFNMLGGQTDGTVHKKKRERSATE